MNSANLFSGRVVVAFRTPLFRRSSPEVQAVRAVSAGVRSPWQLRRVLPSLEDGAMSEPDIRGDANVAGAIF
jgi:hypothetical protein